MIEQKTSTTIYWIQTTVTKKEPKEEDVARKKQASGLLKSADKLFKAGDLPGALLEIENALSIDPGNFYARAYKERIQTALQQPNAQEHSLNKTANDPPEEKSPEERQKYSEDESELQKKLKADRQRIEEEKNRKDMENKRAEQELHRRALEAEISRTREAEELARKRVEEQSRMQTEEQRKQLEAEARKKEEERRRAAEEETKRIEAEARRKAEEIARQKLEEELRKRQEDEKVRKQEEEVIRAAQEEGRREAQKQKIQEYLKRVRQFAANKDYDSATLDLLKILLFSPENTEAVEIQKTIQSEKQTAREKELEEVKNVPRQFFLDTYKEALKSAWSDGVLSETEKSLLENMRGSLQISADEHSILEPESKREAYISVLRDAYQGGPLPNEEVNQLEKLRSELDISADEGVIAEQKVRAEIGR